MKNKDPISCFCSCARPANAISTTISTAYRNQSEGSPHMWSLIWMAWRTSSLNVTWSASERNLTKWLPRRMVCSPITIESTPLSPIMSRASGIWISTERALSNTKLRISRSMIRRILQSWSGLPSQNMRANPYGSRPISQTTLESASSPIMFRSIGEGSLSASSASRSIIPPWRNRSKASGCMATAMHF